MAAKNILKKNLLIGIFDDGDKLYQTVVNLRERGIEIFDCYTPYPVHNLDKAMGVKRSRLVFGAFLCGLVGFLCGISLQLYTMTDTFGTFKSWPMIIGGKPLDWRVIPSFVPVTFELTILFTAFGMGILFFARSRMVHGIEEDLIDIRQTDDRLVLAVEPQKLNISKKEFEALIKEEGAVEFYERNTEKTKKDE
ncbi:MAG: DUF3341 domain-containing protein [Bacteroidota bacterium]|nr:DUF3341 domain-containing protein [Bacteroidota bacterium]